MSTYEKLSLILQAIGHLLVFGSIVYAAKSFRVAARAEIRTRSEKTMDYASTIMQDISKSYRYIAESRKELQSLQPNQLNPELQFHCNYILNKLEELSTRISTSLYDQVYNKQLLLSLLGPIMQSVLILLKTYIQHNRKFYAEPELFVNFELMTEQWKMIASHVE